MTHLYSLSVVAVVMAALVVFCKPAEGRNVKISAEINTVMVTAGKTEIGATNAATAHTYAETPVSVCPEIPVSVEMEIKHQSEKLPAAGEQRRQKYSLYLSPPNDNRPALYKLRRLNS